jgi:hypothetical protein
LRSKVPEEADARHALLHPALRFVLRVEANAEKGEALVVKHLPVGGDGTQRGPAMLVSG